MILTVSPATPADSALLAGLMQFYIYDFSEIAPEGSRDYDVEPDGLFRPYPYLDAYWQEDGRWPLIFRLDGAAIGFALVNQISNRADGFVERNMAEFFIMRQHRRRGLAAAALAQVLKLHPGRWEVAVLDRNPGALAFWPKALGAAGVNELERLDGGETWAGPVWTFTA
ncbi:GNAT family N-acetyltransferase [Caulobacter mirabilis]|uniref:Acetyltransferase n=1 Tax=Caulobacter mirabilis TaxID=69666 RepID=A0A2D2AXL3_9CAUL|nr:GNAT family N-acetyltransferase [Caulobacter mirabilis]ATQ42677.1 acetyltransferase [Caulobacter mirabilis]